MDKLTQAREALTERITAYLAGGGLFNPELADHDAVSQLLIDCRAALASLEPAAPGREEASEELRREIEYDVKARLRLAFRKALADLPEIAPREIASVLSSVHMQDAFFNEGKRLQGEFGTDAVAPRVEQECGAGAWSFMRQGVREALSPPAGKDAVQAVTDEQRGAIAYALTKRLVIDMPTARAAVDEALSVKAERS